MLRISDRGLGLVALGAILASVAGLDLPTSFHRVAGQLATRAGLSEAADRHLARAVRGSREQAANGLAEDLLRLGTHYWHTGRLDACRRALEQAIELYPEDPSFDRSRRSMILLALIDVYDELGLFAEAVASARELLRLAEHRLGADHLLVAGVLDTLASLHSRDGDLEAAQELQRRALSIRESNLGSTHPEVASTLTRFGRLLADQGDLDRAEPVLEKSVSILRSSKHTDGFHWFVTSVTGRSERAVLLLTALNELGLIHQKEERFREAWILYEEALALPVAASPQRVALLINASNVLLRMGRAREAIDHAEVALKSVAGVDMPDSIRRSLAAGAANARIEAIRSLDVSSSASANALVRSFI